jgi:hypothetical protein
MANRPLLLIMGGETAGGGQSKDQVLISIDLFGAIDRGSQRGRSDVTQFMSPVLLGLGGFFVCRSGFSGDKMKPYPLR